MNHLTLSFLMSTSKNPINYVQIYNYFHPITPHLLSTCQSFLSLYVFIIRLIYQLILSVSTLSVILGLLFSDALHTHLIILISSQHRPPSMTKFISLQHCTPHISNISLDLRESPTSVNKVVRSLILLHLFLILTITQALAVPRVQIIFSTYENSSTLLHIQRTPHLD